MVEAIKQIGNIKQKLLEVYHKDPEHYHEKDIANILLNDWPVERFISACKTEDEALNRLTKAMQWRNTFGVNQFTDNYFPRTIYNREEWFIYGKDRDGRPLIWMRGKNHLKNDKYSTLLKQFTIHQFEKLDSQVSHQGWAMVIDTTNMRLFNADIGYFKFLIESFQHYPFSFKYVAIVNMPWMLNPFARLISSLMGEELKNTIKFISKEDLRNYLDSDTIPVHLGGSNESNMCHIPSSLNIFNY